MNETAAHTSAAAAVLTVATWRQLYPHAVSGLYQPLIDACDAREITSPVRLAAFLAQWSHESLGFTRMYESFAYRSADRLVSVFGRRLLPANASVRGREAQKAAAALLRTRGAEAIANRVYAGRNGNGDEASGDGWRYCGRGIPQLTGRGNYREAGQALALPLEDKPELAALPEYTPAIAAWARVPSAAP